MLKLFCILILLAAVGFIALNYKEWFVKPSFSEDAKTKHLVVIFLDALNAGDFAEFSKLPNFREILASGSYAKEVVGVYPSLTYPAHTSIITGKYPKNHGVVNNEFLQPGVEKPDWYWYKKYVKGPTLYDMAKRSNMRVGSIFWPATAKADIDYNLPEIWPNRKGQNQVLLSLSTGSPAFLLGLQLRYGSIRNGTHQPELDDFSTASACQLIRSKKPNLLLLHLTDLDKQRHLHGGMSNDAKEAVRRHDKRLGLIIQAVKDAGIYSDTTFIVLGDHGFLDVQNRVDLNVLFKSKGLITTDKDGRLTDWKAVVSSCDGAAYVYLKEPGDEKVRKTVENLLSAVKTYTNLGIEAVYRREEAAKMGASDSCDYMLEARDGYYFGNNIEGELVVRITPGKVDEDKNLYAATHGFDPKKPGYRTFFMAAGTGIKKGVVLPEMEMVDACPTMAALLGIRMTGMDGKTLDSILEK